MKYSYFILLTFAFRKCVLATTLTVYNRSLRITREGWFFMGFTLAVGIAAINTGNNLMYLVLGMMLSVMVVSGVLSENALRRIRIERRMPLDARANRPFTVQYSLTNPKRIFPSYSLRLQEKGIESQTEAFALRIGAGERIMVEGLFIAKRRGLLNFTEARILTQFPFGLFEKTKMVELKGQLVVFPDPIYADEDAKGAVEWGAEESGAIKGEGVGLFGLREYHDGDNPRRIHWKLSAKAGKLIMKETEAMDLPMMAIVLDTTGYRPERDDDALELAVSKCAGLAENYIKRGYMVKLVTGNNELPYGNGLPHLRNLLTSLALFEPSPGAVGVAHLRPGEANVVVRMDSGQ